MAKERERERQSSQRVGEVSPAGRGLSIRCQSDMLDVKSGVCVCLRPSFWVKYSEIRAENPKLVNSLHCVSTL